MEPSKCLGKEKGPLLVPKGRLEPPRVGFYFLFEESLDHDEVLAGDLTVPKPPVPSSITADFRLGVLCASEMQA